MRVVITWSAQTGENTRNIPRTRPHLLFTIKKTLTNCTRCDLKVKTTEMYTNQAVVFGVFSMVQIRKIVLFRVIEKWTKTVAKKLINV